MSAIKPYLVRIWTKILGAIILVFGLLFLSWLTVPSFIISIASGLMMFMVVLLIIAGIILLFF